jgi:nucleotide-binding universal stress UspA family protein
MTPNAAKRRKAARRPARRTRVATAPPQRPQIRTVLIPIDFSQPSLEVIEFVLPLVRFFGGELHLIHVVSSDYPLASLAGMPLVVPELEVGRHVRERLKDVAAKYSAPVRREDIHVLKGRPFEQICRLARERRIDLIITSTRGQTGFKHALLGSTAERIVRYSPCPVLVARPPARKSDRRMRSKGLCGFAKILVPVDFSRSSARGLAFAMNLAGRLKSKLVLLHSVYLQYYVASDEYARYDFPKLLALAEKAAREQMRALVHHTDWGRLKVQTRVEVGHAGQQICARAQDLGVDLIVTSTHGRTGFQHVLLGSTAEYVVRHAHCSVLVVPARGRPGLRITPTQ